MDISTLKGALKSKTVWWNILLALLASMELFAGHLTVLFGQSVASAVLLLGAMLNLALRVVTTQALSAKGEVMIKRGHSPRIGVLGWILSIEEVNADRDPANCKAICPRNQVRGLW
jgi:hypothetical protein